LKNKILNIQIKSNHKYGVIKLSPIEDTLIFLFETIKNH